MVKHLLALDPHAGMHAGILVLEIMIRYHVFWIQSTDWKEAEKLGNGEMRRQQAPFFG